MRSPPGARDTPDRSGQAAIRERQASLERSSALTAAATVLSRLTGLIRLVVIAYALGSSDLADAFNLSNNTPNMIHDLVLGGILAADVRAGLRRPHRERLP